MDTLSFVPTLDSNLCVGEEPQNRQVTPGLDPILQGMEEENACLSVLEHGPGPCWLEEDKRFLKTPTLAPGPC